MDTEAQLKDKDIYPNENVIKEALGEAYSSYVKLYEMFETLGLEHEWRYYNDGKSWLCKILKKKRTIIWVSVWKGYTKAGVYFPVSKIDLVMDLSLSQKTKERIEITPNIGKSKPCFFDIKDDSEFDDLRKIIELKISN